MNVSMWMRAVRVIPRVSREEWAALDLISRWLIATRSAVLVMTLTSAALAGLLALREHRFHFGLWSVLTLGLLLAHAANNLVNDITDHLRGVDRDNYFRAQYGPQPLEHGLMTKLEAVAYAAVTGALALAAGLVLVAVRGQPVLVLLAIGSFFVLFYTWPLKWLGLGEVAVFLVWGPLMVGGGYFAITGEISGGVVVASMPPALLATAVLLGKHIDKLDADAAKGIRTMPVLLGERRARYATIGAMATAYAVVAGLVAAGYFSLFVLLVAGAVPCLVDAVRVFSHPRPAAPPPQYPRDVWPLWYAAFAFRHTRRFSGLFLFGLALDAIARWTGLG